MPNKNYNFNQKLDKISQMEIETKFFEFVRRIKKIYIKLRKVHLSQCWHAEIYEVPVMRFPYPNYETILLSLILLFQTKFLQGNYR